MKRILLDRSKAPQQRPPERIKVASAFRTKGTTSSSDGSAEVPPPEPVPDPLLCHESLPQNSLHQQLLHLHRQQQQREPHFEEPANDESVDGDDDIFGATRRMASRLLSPLATSATADGGSVGPSLPRPHRMGLGSEDPRLESSIALMDSGDSAIPPESPTPAPLQINPKKGLPWNARIVSRPQGVAWISPGKSICFLQGPHSGLMGTVVHFDPAHPCVSIQLSVSGECVEAEPFQIAPSIFAPLAMPSPSLPPFREDRSTVNSSLWMFPHVLVRVSSRDWQQGKFYHRMAVIDDVITTTTAASLGGRGKKTALITLLHDRRLHFDRVDASLVEPVEAQLGRPAIIIRNDPPRMYPLGTRVRVLALEDSSGAAAVEVCEPVGDSFEAIMVLPRQCLAQASLQ